MTTPIRVVACAAFASIAISIGGCCDCDPFDEARELAGDGASSCGYAFLDEDRQPIIDCLVAASASGTRSVGGYAEQGTDSKAAIHFAVSGAMSGWTLLYDSDPSGGGGACARITAFRSDGPLTQSTTMDVFGRPRVSWPQRGRAQFPCD